MEDVTVFDGREWVNATRRYYELAPHLVLETDRWDRRLKHIHIPLCAPDCRQTKVGNIAELETQPRVRKAVYVLKSVWDAAMEKCAREGPRRTTTRRPTESDAGERAPPAQDPETDPEPSQTGDDEPRAAEEEPHHDSSRADIAILPRISLDASERFVYDGRRYDVQVYGERTFSGLFLDARDVSAAIGMRFCDMPDAVVVEEYLVDDVPKRVLSWHQFLHLTFLKAASHPVANAISVWVSSTMFTVQYGGGESIVKQSEFASRHARYSLATYAGHLEGGDMIIYAIDAFPAASLEDAYPGTVAPLVPDGKYIDKRVVKIGCGRRDRIGPVRSDLNNILPGHDPRPIFVLRVPSVTDQELEDKFEKVMHAEFSDVRIGCNGRPKIPGPRHDAYTELFVVDLELKELAQRLAYSLVDRHMRRLNGETEKHLETVRKELTGMGELRMELRVEKAKNEHLGTALEKSDAALTKSEDECARLRETITQLLPRKMSALKSAFSRSTNG